MGRTRQQDQQIPDEQQLAAIAEALAAGVGAAALADVLMGVLPLAAFVGSSQLAGVVAGEVASFAAEAGEIPDLRGDREPGELLAVFGLQNLLMRAAYLRAAASRLGHAIREAPREGVSQAVEAWRDKERQYLALHLQAQARRTEGGALVFDAIQTYGEVIGWYATLRPTNRPHHRAAHRHNWRPLLGPPLQTGAYPRVLPFCLCYPGPPIPGAPEIR